MNFKLNFQKTKIFFKNKILILLVLGIVYLFVNYIFYLQNSKYYTSPFVALYLLLFILIPHYFNLLSNKRLTKNEKLAAHILVGFILKVKNINIEEKEKIADILNQIYRDKNPDTVMNFLYEENFDDFEESCIKMAKKDIFYKNLLLKNLFRCALEGYHVSLETENIIREIAAKIKVGKASYNKRKFFCEKAGFRFESLQGKKHIQEFNIEFFELSEAYRTLEIMPDASEKEIKQAKRRLAKQFHPDKNVDNELIDNKKFIEITKAYNTIKIYRGFK